jgi:ketosteroid isomerase-like protein
MKKAIIYFTFLSVFHFNSYSQSKTKVDKEKIINEIRAVEERFQNDLKTYGAENAFYKYAAENAVIKRGKDSLIFGNLAIKNYYSNPAYRNAIAEWKPDYVDISDDGSMAYTYGKYKWSFTDEKGKTTIYEGVFHTVWKKMNDSSWKYVWD